MQNLAASLIPMETVWGGDCNHALASPTKWSGSRVGRSAITDLVEALKITVPTADLPHRRPGILSVDHVGVPQACTITDATRIDVPAVLSDHDIHVVTADSG